MAPDLKTYRDRMDKSVSALKEEFNGLRTGRANVGLLDPVQVQAYGSNAPLNSVAAISVPEPRMISVNVWDKSMVGPVEKAIRAAAWLNPIVDGRALRIPVPPPRRTARTGQAAQIPSSRSSVQRPPRRQ
jgi:ribosome recycling factor